MRNGISTAHLASVTGRVSFNQHRGQQSRRIRDSSQDGAKTIKTMLPGVAAPLLLAASLTGPANANDDRIRSVVVKTFDLDLNSADGQRRLGRRIHRPALAICPPRPRIGLGRATPASGASKSRLAEDVGASGAGRSDRFYRAIGE